MGVLAEYLRTEGSALKAQKAKRLEELSEWLESLNALYRQIKEWLVACDPDNLIEKSIEQVPGRELAFGEHQVPVLKLSLVDHSVRLVPVARYMAALVRPPGRDKA